MNLFAHTWFMMMRNLRAVARSPFIIMMNLIQPILWLLLFSTLFQNIIQLPGFSTDSYLTFFTPGIIVMSTLMAGSYAGMGTMMDHQSGALTRFLVSPVQRVSLIFGPLLQHAVTMMIQALIMIGLAFLIGARFPGGFSGILILMLSSILLGLTFGAFSIALALLVRQVEALMSAASLLTMPLMFMSGLFLPLDLVPLWIQRLASFNPVHWAIEAGREALMAQSDWSVILLHLTSLSLLLFASCAVALLAFRSYRRSV